MLALLFGDAFAKMVANHGGMPAVQGGVVGGAAEDFGNEGCDMLEVLLRHLGEEGSEDWVGGNLFVEAGDEAIERFAAA